MIQFLKMTESRRVVDGIAEAAEHLPMRLSVLEVREGKGNLKVCLGSTCSRRAKLD